MISLDKNPRLKTDFVKEGVNVSRLYREIDKATPKRIDGLKVEGEFDFDKENYLTAGKDGHFYSIGGGDGAKVYVNRFKSLRDLTEAFSFARKGFVNFKVGEAMGWTIPKLNGFYLVKDNESGKLNPAIVMEDLKNTVGLGGYQGTNLNNDLQIYLKKRKDMEACLIGVYQDNDIKPGNFIWSQSRNEFVFIDSDDWKFKGVHDLK